MSDLTSGTQSSMRRRELVSRAVAVLVAVGSCLVAFRTSGVGGLATSVGVATCVVSVLRRLGRHRVGGELWTAVVVMTVVVVVWNAVSCVRYVATYNGDSVTQRVATWGRDHGFSPVIDRLESRVFSEPPSATPAAALPIAVPTTWATTSETSSAPSPTSTVPIVPDVQPPTPLTPVIEPPLPGEGEWLPVASAGGRDAMWVTSVRPLADVGSVTATVAMIDPTDVRVGMFNGRELPGGDWRLDDHVPLDLAPALLAAMNGGFRLEHLFGGYKTEGVVVKPLENGRGTIGITYDGRMEIGELGRDMVDDGSWTTLRQNGILMVDAGRSQIERARQERVTWGADDTGDLFVNRSAVCVLWNGRIAYVMAGKVDPTQMAEILIRTGCDRALQLDINGQWPNFTVFTHGAEGGMDGFVIDRRMRNDPFRYLKVSSKEFFAFFDSTSLPSVSVLDD